MSKELEEIKAIMQMQNDNKSLRAENEKLKSELEGIKNPKLDPFTEGLIKG